jgi:hypothetical protein
MSIFWKRRESARSFSKDFVFLEGGGTDAAHLSRSETGEDVGSIERAALVAPAPTMV